MKLKDGTLIQMNKIGGICTTFLYIAASKLRIFAIFASRINTFFIPPLSKDFKEITVCVPKVLLFVIPFILTKCVYLFLLNYFMKNKLLIGKK